MPTWLKMCFVGIHVAKHIYKIKYLTFKRPQKHFNNNWKNACQTKTNLEKLIFKKIKKTFFFFLRSSISLIFLCILALFQLPNTAKQYTNLKIPTKIKKAGTITTAFFTNIHFQSKVLMELSGEAGSLRFLHSRFIICPCWSLRTKCQCTKGYF